MSFRESDQNAFLEWSQRKNSISEFLVSYCRHLRDEGFTIGPNEISDVLNGVIMLGAIQSYVDLKNAVKTILVKTPGQYKKFDTLFDSFWDETHKGYDSKIKEGKGKQSPGKKPQKETSFKALTKWLQGNKEEEEEEVSGYSSDIILGQKLFAEISEDEVRDLMNLMHLIGRKLALQLNRRNARASKGKIDIRKLIRQNLTTGGEFFQLFYKDRKKSRQRIVLVCDVSRSMELYSRFLIHFAYSFQQSFKSVETFLFSTSLYRATPAFRMSKATMVLKKLSDEIEEWGGGTRIGECLATFSQKYLRKYVQSNTLVLILSDGWDTGEPGMVRDAMKTIFQKAFKVIWLNPLMGRDGYEPATNALKEAAPYIHVMLPVHHAASLKLLAKAI